MDIKEKIEKTKSKLRKTGIGVMTALTLTSGGFSANAQNNTKSNDDNRDENVEVAVRQTSRHSPVVTGLSPREAISKLVSEMNADGFSNQDIGLAMYSYSQYLSGNKEALNMLKSENQKKAALKICEDTKFVIEYGEMVGDKDVLQDVLNETMRTAKELGADKIVAQQQEKSTIQFRQIPNDNLKYGVNHLKYAIKDGSVVMQGSVSGNLDPILPPMYKHKNGTYSIGKARATNISVVNSVAIFNMQQMIMNQVIADDMQKVASESGRELTEVERNFIAGHQQDMKDWGLEVQKDGVLRQTQGENAGKGLTVSGRHVNNNLVLNRNHSR